MRTQAWLLLLNFSVSAVCSAEVKPTTQPVRLEGRLVARNYPDANGKRERALVLLLSKPIDVPADDLGGPAHGVREIQLVLPMEVFPKKKGYLGKRIVVEGKLFYAHTAHHHTEVLMDVKKVKKLE